MKLKLEFSIKNIKSPFVTDKIHKIKFKFERKITTNVMQIAVCFRQKHPIHTKNIKFWKKERNGLTFHTKVSQVFLWFKIYILRIFCNNEQSIKNDNLETNTENVRHKSATTTLLNVIDCKKLWNSLQIFRKTLSKYQIRENIMRRSQSSFEVEKTKSSIELSSLEMIGKFVWVKFVIKK